MLRIDNLIDDAKCYESVRQIRWPVGVRCVWCQSDQVKRRGLHQRQRERQRYHCKACNSDFDDLTNTIFAHHHQPLRKWILCLYLMGLNLSNEQIEQELDLDKDDVHQMTAQLRSGVVDLKPEPQLEGTVECDEVYIVAGHKGHPEAVKQRTIKPIITETISPGTMVMTDEYDIYAKLPQWGYGHKTVCHSKREFARDEDGDGFCEVHVNRRHRDQKLRRGGLACAILFGVSLVQ